MSGQLGRWRGGVLSPLRDGNQRRVEEIRLLKHWQEAQEKFPVRKFRYIYLEFRGRNLRVAPASLYFAIGANGLNFPSEERD